MILKIHKNGILQCVYFFPTYASCPYCVLANVCFRILFGSCDSFRPQLDNVSEFITSLYTIEEKPRCNL